MHNRHNDIEVCDYYKGVDLAGRHNQKYASMCSLV
jgi:hypothetical protein